MPTSSSLSSISDVSNLASHTALTAFGGVGDFLIVIILFVVLFVFAYYIGRGPFVGTILALYTAYALYAAFPYMAFLPTEPPVTALFTHMGLYLGLTVIFYIIVRRVVVSDFLYIGGFGLLLLALLVTGFLLALAYHVFPVTTIYHFSPAIDMIFAPKEFFFWWFAAPAIGLFFIAR